MKGMNEKKAHLAFLISLWAKGVFAVSEVLGGIATYLVTPGMLTDIVRAVTQEELAEDPRDFIANALLHAAQNLSISTKSFTALYLLSHGVIKLWLVIGLLRERRSYYPVALGVFGFFIVYQLYRFTFTHAPLLLVITAVDVVVIGLVWHEYTTLRPTSSENP